METRFTSTVKCPNCGFKSKEEMPKDSCVWSYLCKKCGFSFIPKSGDCCIFCSYGSDPCPPVQIERSVENEKKHAGFIQNKDINEIIRELEKQTGNKDQRISQGVAQTAGLWQEKDGEPEEFREFCLKNFLQSEKERKLVFHRIEYYLESLYGNLNKLTLELQWNLHVDQGEIHNIDLLFAGYDPSAHLTNDLYKNKIAFLIVLNFPHLNLAGKTELNANTTILEWAYIRLGDIFTARVPSDLIQTFSQVNSSSESYISQYNICVRQLLDGDGSRLFDKGSMLLSHWGLRDEIKANYSVKDGLERQRLLYKVMERIVAQEIPHLVINSQEYKWDPYQNSVFNQKGEIIKLCPEPLTRYQHILNFFKIQQAMDPYYPESLNTYIKRKFENEMEIPCQQVEVLFENFLSSPLASRLAELIHKRLGRPLEPFDLWYDGFKSRSRQSQQELDRIVQAKYADSSSFEADIPLLLKKLGFSAERAEFIADRITVDNARGSGHAWGAEMKTEIAHLRTRIPGDGMNYKGYNVAIHELGHNVEQTISLHNVESYLIKGVPNTSFTEALAFAFQSRDLQLLDLEDRNPLARHLRALDTFWCVFEIMGVSLVDIKTWQFLYANPDTDASGLKDAVIQISKDLWNRFFANIIGHRDQNILAVYSHMISYPLYLPAYAFGHLIDFQIEQHLFGKDFAAEIERIFSIGRLTPNQWMEKAVGKPLSAEPLLISAEEALKKVKQ